MHHPSSIAWVAVLTAHALAAAPPYPVVDTGQTTCFDKSNEITAPSLEQPFFGQDAQYQGFKPSYTISKDGLSVLDHHSGLTWMKQLAHDSSHSKYNAAIGPNTSYRFTYDGALAEIAKLNSQNYAGFHDWRLPSIKELLSIAQFIGDARTKVPFFDATVFDWVDVTTTGKGLGPEMGQIWSSTAYVGAPKDRAFFFFNFADGHLKRGPGRAIDEREGKANLLRPVRGDSYGLNLFVDQNDGTILDRATGLVWTKSDSGIGMDWPSALAWVQQKNHQNFLGHHDWRLPNAKELQSIVDYSRAPDALTGIGTQGPAIDPIFQITSIPSAFKHPEYPWFWSSTTDSETHSHRFAYYVCFGCAQSVMRDARTGEPINTHGAGAVRSEPKSADGKDWSRGLGPSPSDAVRILNFVRLVRQGATSVTPPTKPLTTQATTRMARPPESPAVTAIDANKNGILEADELAHAAETLKTLDQNRDGKLTADEYRLHPMGVPSGIPSRLPAGKPPLEPQTNR